MKNLTHFFNYAANTPQNTGGGNSQFLRSESVRSTLAGRRLSNTLITHESPTNHPLKQSVWKVAAMLLMVLTLGVGNAWGDDIFTATPQATSEVKVASISSYTDFTAAQATFTGGSMQYKQTNSTAKAILEPTIGPSGDKRKCFRIETNDCSFKVVLNSALQNGDVISADLFNNNVDIWFSTSTSRPGSAPTTKISASGGTSSAWNAKSYTVATSDGICGQTTFYIYRNSNTTQFSHLTITRSTPSCSSNPADPTGLSAGSITADGATFTITDGANTNNYEIVCKTSSTTPAADATPTKTGTSKTLAVTGLDDGTTYYAWVRSVCDATHKSAWVALSGTFTTKPCSISGCGNASLTYVIKVGSSGSQATDGSDFITSATPSDPTALGASTTVGLNTITISDGTMKAAAATNACYSSKPNMTGKIGMHNGSSYSSSKYLQFTFTVKEGYTFTPCDIQFVVQPVSAGGSFRWEVTDGTTSYGYGTGDAGQGNPAGATVLTGLSSTSEMSAGTYYIRLYPYYNGDNTFRLGTDVVLRGTTAEATPACEATAEAGENKETTEGVGVAMAATAATSGYTGAWSIKAGSPSTATSQLSSTAAYDATFTPSAIGTYTLVWTVTDDSDGSCTASDEATVTVSAPPASGWYLKGSFDTWGEGYAMTGTGTVSVERTLDAGHYQFKIVNGSDWYGDGETFGGTRTQEVSATGTSNNCHLVISETGTYRFDYNTQSHTLTITYPNSYTYYYSNTEGWSKVYVYKFSSNEVTGDNNTWPGVEIASPTSLCGDYYSTTSDGYAKIIFTNGLSGDDKQQTGDMIVASADAGKYVAGKGSAWVAMPTFTVTYNKNGDGAGNDGAVTGNVPTDANAYACGGSVTVLGNIGNLALAGYSFAGWNTAANGTSTAKVADETYAISDNTTFFAQWQQEVPTSVTVDGGWRYFPGQTITLTATPTGGTSDFTYQWQQSNGSQWENIGTNAATYTKENCVVADARKYRCIVSKAGASVTSNAYNVHIYTLEGDYSGGSDWTVYNIAQTSGTVGTVAVTLDASSLFEFGIRDNYTNNWYRNTNFIVDNWTNEGFGQGSGNCRLFTGPEGNYTFTVDINHVGDGTPYMEVSVAYPSVTHPAAGYAYFKKWNDWAGYYIHWWYNDGSADHPLTEWGSDVHITNETTICGTDYIYFPVIANYDQLKIKDAAGDASHYTGNLSSEGSSGKYFDFTNDNAWNTFATYTISFAGNGSTSGEMSDIENIACGANQALTANAFAKTGYTFSHWTADVAVTVGDATITAGDPIADGATIQNISSDIALTAQWKQVIKLINFDGENYSLNTDKFVIYPNTSLQNESYTVGDVTYAKNFQFGNTCSTTPFAGAAYTNRILAYDVTTNNTGITLYLYNRNGSNKKLYYQIVYEGASAGSLQTVTVNGNQGKVVEIPNIQTNKGARILFGIESKDVRVCQIEVEENGTALPAFGTNGYQLSIPGRAATESKVITFDGFEFNVNSDLKFISGQNNAPLRGIDGSNYIKFTAPANIQLQVTTANSQKFYVCAENKGDAENDTQYGGSASTHNINLHAGTYYIVPTASGSGGEVQITKLAFATAPNAVIVSFDANGGDADPDDQVLFTGEKAVAPTAPTYEGYRLLGWSEDASAEPVVLYDFDDEVTANLALTAVWQQVWTVTFDSNGGSAVAAAIVDHNTAVTKPSDPTKAGNDFAGWTLSGVAYDFSTPVTANITLLATWTALDNDASISALTYDGNDIDISLGTDFAYVLPYKAEFDDEKLAVTKSALSASVGEITYSAGVASFTVTAGDGETTQTYTVTFTNAPKDLLCLVWAEMTAENTLTLDESKSALDIEVTAAGSVRPESTPSEYQGYTGYKFTNEGSYTELKDGNFKSGDKVDVFVVATCGDKMRVYGANEATDANIVAISENNMVQGHNPVTLTADAASLYLRRGVKKDGETYNGWNPHIAYIAVYRAYPVPLIESISFNGAAGTIDGTTITATIPYTTNMSSLPIEATFMSNDPASTSGDVGGPWTETSTGVYTNSYVVRDKDGDTNTYTVTLTRADVSHDASLTALAVEGYEISFAAATLNYNVELPYGSTISNLPAVTYTAAAGATAVKTDATVLPGYTTITVTAEDESTVQEYKIYFHANQTPTFAIYDGSTMDAIAESGSDVLSGFAWTITGASKTNGESGAKSFEGKNYAKYVNLFTSATKAPSDGDTRYMTITIPEGYLAKFRLVGCGNGNDSRSFFISKEISSTVDESIAYATTTSSNAMDGRTSDFQFPGTYYLCSNNSIRLYELSVTLYHIDHSRDVTQGRYGTICLPNGGLMVGAAIFEVAHMTYQNAQPYKVFFDEVLNGVMEAGMPYIFMPKEGVTSIAVTYTDNADASAGNYNGLHGTLDYMDGDALYGKYIFSNNSIFMSVYSGNWLNANRAYIVLSEVPDYASAPAPGRRRVAMGFNGEQAQEVATGLDEITNDQSSITNKLLINGELFILRGEKMYDVTGKLVK